MKTYDELTPEQQEQAREYVLKIVKKGLEADASWAGSVSIIGAEQAKYREPGELVIDLAKLS